MRISLSIPEEFTVTNHGYGVISQQIVESLQRLGWSVPYRDPSCPVELNIGQPYNWVWSSRKSYRIGLVAWESTKIPQNWKAPIRMAHEVWTPSPVIAEWLKAEGVNVTQVYEHGVDASLWTPRLRKGGDRIKFLHIGEPAPRKGGQLTYDVFKELYGNDDRASLTVKAFSQNTIRGRNGAHIFKECSNVKVINDVMEEWELIQLVKRHDVLIYPSFGEGFGLIPLQAMATGMPVICTEAWAPYASLLLPSLRVKSSLGPSPWSFHTGQVFYPDREDLKRAMKCAVDDFSRLADDALSLAPAVARRYDWDRLTERAFAKIKNRFASPELADEIIFSNPRSKAINGTLDGTNSNRK